MNPTIDEATRASATEAEGEGEPTPCDRCGAFETLRSMRGQRLCAACTERVLHPIEKAPLNTESLLMGTWEVARQLWWRSLLLLMAFELPFLVLTTLVPAAERVDRYSWVITVIADGALILLAMQVIEGGKVSVGDALREAMQRWGSMVWVTFLSNLLILLLALLLIVPGVLRALSYAVVLPVVLHEDGRGGSALSTSARLMEGHRSALFVTWLLLFLPAVLFFAAYLAVALWFEGSFGEAPVAADGIYRLVDVIGPALIVLSLFPVKLLPAVIYAKVRRARGGE